jgi:hypothetical protein
VKTLKEKYAVKSPLYTAEKNRSALLRHEYDALVFLSRFHLAGVPKVSFLDSENCLLGMEYIEGKRPSPTDYSIQAIVDFCNSLNAVFKCDPTFGFAVDSVTSSQDIISQIRQRISIAPKDISHFSHWQEIEKLLGTCIEELTIQDVDFTSQTYSLSDLGLHNIIDNGSQFYFIDYEYFGSDSPYKLLSDFLIHPNNDSLTSYKKFIAHNLLDSFALEVKGLLELLPFISLKWATITQKRLDRMRVKNLDSSEILTQSKLVEKYIWLSQLRGYSLLDYIFNDKIGP